MCRKYSYGFDSNHHQIACYFNDKKQVVYQKVRKPNKVFHSTGNLDDALLFGQHLFPSGGRQLIITEGEVDCLSVSMAVGMTWPVVSIPSGAQSAAKAIKSQLTWIESFDTIILAFDGDDVGVKAAQEVAGFLKIGHTKIAVYPEGCKDANDCWKKKLDLGAIIRFQSQTFRPDGIIAGEDLWEDLADHYDGESGMSYPYPYPELTKRTLGQRKGELTMWTAGTGVGKSTIVNEIGYDLLVNQELKLGVIALEESKKITGLRYLSLHTSKRLHLDPKAVSFDEYKGAFDATTGSGRMFLYDHFGSMESDSLLSKIRYLAVACECDFIILDHISIAVSGIQGDDERKVLDVLMTGLRSLVEQTGVGIHAVCHLRRTGGAGHEEGERVTLGHLRGTGGIAQMSDTVLAAERNLQDDTEGTQLRVLKCRFTGDSGPADVIKYNKDTGRFDLQEETNLFPKGDDTHEDY